MPLSVPLPNSTMRLLAHYCGSEVKLQAHRAFLIGRLFEEGDSRDLRWLTKSSSEEELLSWLRTHGGRQLSKRSLAFWSTLLASVDGITDPPPATEDLWPL